MKDTIEHQGVIESIDGSHIRVNIVQQAACGACKVKSMCSQSEQKEKIVDVYEADASSRRSVGDSVTVCGTLTMGKQAVLLAFTIPLAITVVWMFVALAWLKMDELQAVVLLCGPLLVYFFWMYVMRDKIAKRFAFWIK
ncbi:MAG: SoxR reducing system RseC family protein [Prevotellaceae bacterium]|nr:SoxR reducing system RseC family protein [Candidatus Minthosoma equi]